MASFVLYLLVCFGLGCRMVELHPSKKEEAFSNQRSDKTNSKGKTIFTAEDAEGSKECQDWSVGCGRLRDLDRSAPGKPRRSLTMTV
jgi:hypothetical protein